MTLGQLKKTHRYKELLVTLGYKDCKTRPKQVLITLNNESILDYLKKYFSTRLIYDIKEHHG